jgi:hypothetical protein
MRGATFPTMLTFFKKRCASSASDRLERSHLGFRVAPDVKASMHSEGLVLIHLGRGTVFSANRAGAMIWNGAAERWSLDRVAATISAEFQISPEAAQQDATKFLAQLAAEGLLVSDPS